MVTEAPTSRRDDQKLELVERILRGQLTLQEACAKYGVSGPELKDWMRLYRREARRVLDDRVRAALSTQGMELEDLESAEFSGNVETLAVAEVIQTMALGRKDAEILIDHDGQQSRIWCAQGDVVDAECGRLLGAPAVYRLLSVQHGRVYADCSAQSGARRRPRTINVSTQALLMEAARRSDECRELCRRLGDMNVVYVTSGVAMSPDVQATPTEFAVLRLLDGHRSLAGVVRDSSLPDLETLVHLVQLRERGLLDPRVTPPPPLREHEGAARASGQPPSTRLSQRSSAAPDEPAEPSFVPLAASLGARHEPRWSRRWGWGFVALGASTLGLALFLRYSEREDGKRVPPRVAGAAPAAATRAPGAAGRAAAVGAGVPALAPVVLPPTPPANRTCPEGAALLARPLTRDAAAQVYCLDRFEATAASYGRCVDESACAATPREAAPLDAALSAGARRRAQAAFAAQCNVGAAGRGQHPMNCVTYTEAGAYCAWRGGRLPSDAEWEFAAEGVRGRAYPWGSELPGPGLVNACGSECRSWYGSLALQGVFEGLMYEGNDGYAGTAPVASFPDGATPEGIVDLIGNVAEWTNGSVEVYDGDRGGDAVASRVVRGGSFTSSQAALKPPVLRLYLGAEERDRGVGFRCAFSLD